MAVKISVECEPDSRDADRLRVLLCEMARKEPEQGYNPLTSTNFNAVLDALVQKAFKEGRNFSKIHPTIKD